MLTIEKINELIKNSGKSKTEFLSNCNFNHNMFDDWKRKGMNPTAEKLIKIAQYFGVSTDYLLGLTDNPKPHYE